jgi:hypothetical protein
MRIWEAQKTNGSHTSYRDICHGAVAEGRIELGPLVILDFDEKVLPNYRCTGKGHQFSWNLSESLKVDGNEKLGRSKRRQ